MQIAKIFLQKALVLQISLLCSIIAAACSNRGIFLRGTPYRSIQHQKIPLIPNFHAFFTKIIRNLLHLELLLNDIMQIKCCFTFLQVEEKSRDCLSRRQNQMSEASKLHRLRAEEEYGRRKKDLESRQEQQYNDLQTKSFAR